MVRFILVDFTTPVKIRPRMETLPVKGHFLSVDGYIGELLQSDGPRWPWDIADFSPDLLFSFIPSRSSLRLSTFLPLPLPFHNVF